MSRNKKSLAVACLLASVCGKAGAMDSTKKINPASRSVSTGMSPVLKKVLIGGGTIVGTTALSFGIWGLTKLFGAKNQKPGNPGEQDNTDNEQKDLQTRKEFHKAFLVLTKSPGKMEIKGNDGDGKPTENNENDPNEILSVIFESIVAGKVINNNEIEGYFVTNTSKFNIKLNLNEEKGNGKTRLHLEIKAKSNKLNITVDAEVFGSTDERNEIEKTLNEEKILAQHENIVYLSKCDELDFVNAKKQTAEGSMLITYMKNVQEEKNYAIINNTDGSILKITYELSDDFKKLNETVEKYKKGTKKEDIENKRAEPTSTNVYEFNIKLKDN